jgi:hypothetical protein
MKVNLCRGRPHCLELRMMQRIVIAGAGRRVVEAAPGPAKNQDRSKGYSASRSSAAARSSSSSAKLFSRSAAGSPTRPRARRRACSARSRSVAGVSAQRGDRGGIVRETHGEKLSLRITNLCYWTRRRPATCSANRRPGYSGHGNSAPAPDDRFYPIGQNLHREWLGQ